MNSMDLYRQRIQVDGATLRDRLVERTKDDIRNHAIDNPSYKEVVVNGEKMNLIIDSTENNNTKKFETIPDGHVDLGTVIDWYGKWMVVDTDYDEEIYQSGKLKKCNYVLRWMNDKRDIIDMDCIVTFPYYSTVSEDKIITVNTTRSQIDIQLTDDTNRIKMGDRFFISRNPVHPVPYYVENVNDVSHVYNGHGYITLSMREDQLNVDEDNIELLICNYKKKKEPVEGEFTSSITSVPKYLIAEYGDTVLTGHFYDNGSEVTDVTPKWEVVCDFIDDLTVTYKDNKCYIATDNVKLIGRSFTVNLTDADGKYKQSSYVLTVRGF